jgi:O-antigen/teichoic acid export membrane protein
MVLSSFKEAMTDTSIALIMNVPINYALLWISDINGMSIMTTTVFMTGVFTIIAVVRKTAIGVHFKRKQING